MVRPSELRPGDVFIDVADVDEELDDIQLVIQVLPCTNASGQLVYELTKILSVYNGIIHAQPYIDNYKIVKVLL